MDVAFLVGDRFELLSAAECCTVSGVSIAHCSGGERTFGAFDDQVRDAVTKLAHMHLVAHAEAADRVRSLQEESWRIAVTGDPGLDAIRHEKRLSAQELEERLGVLPAKTDIVVALHPVTRALDEAGLWLNAIAEFSRDFEGRIFLSAPNGDPGSEAINSAWDSLLKTGRRMVLPSLGGRIFRRLVAACGALVGNSSAGVWEVPSLGVPSLDLGTRQSGRIRGDTVWHCEVADAVELGANIRHLLTPEIQSACRTGQNPYGDGDATPRILDHIARSAQNPRLMVKP
jgi:UDP-hydrolysing UDP-N-acetyl-D-glucosamine 2-epimerase